MGEYARYKGVEVKIGTCEDMYYLRYDQRHLVEAISGSVNPVTDAEALRFRFPWPDEDHIEPDTNGFYEKGYERSLCVQGFTAPEGVDHYSVQFKADRGYLVSLPCPESMAFENRAKPDACADLRLKAYPDLRVARNGFAGAVHLVRQRLIPEVGLVPILRCGGCGAMWREVEIARIEEIAVCLRSEGDRREWEDARGPNGHPGGGKFWHQIADRVLAGLAEKAVA